jgi:aspartyl-tRNA(Asn)/glutamyl-tRNA(Gln) amidotransferase subunit B
MHMSRQPTGIVGETIRDMSESTYTLICGIEIHVELRTASKMFCGCKNDPFHAEKPNIHTCPVCLGMPGALPVANKKAIEWTIKIGQALGCEISLFSKFDRKHYFYPDLPKGYQISQYDQPLCVNGVVHTEFGDIGITRVHLEEDTGKLIHDDVNGEKVSLVDFNRSGVPLVEIVTEPDIHSPEQAKAYAKKISQLIRYLEVSDADMEKGSMRLEANISVQTPDEKIAGKLPSYKVEVKNLNSFRFIERAIAYEITRQSEIRTGGEIPTQETRGWNETKNHTFAQRSKESAEDYRYFPDPDLPPLRFTKEEIEKLQKELPELPDAVLKRWIEQFSLKENDAQILSGEVEMMKLMNQVFVIAQNSQVETGKLASLIVNKKIILKTEGSVDEIAKDIITQMNTLLTKSDISQDVLMAAIQEVIDANEKAVADYKAGKTQVIGFFLGQVSKKLGKIDADQVKALLQSKLVESD